jgi:hypothetical protein
MPTLYGPLSYSLRRIDERTLRFDIPAKIDAPLILRPPHREALRSATSSTAPRRTAAAVPSPLRKRPRK